MNKEKIRISLDRITGAYKDKLSGYAEDLFQTTPPIGGWSYSEVYAHIFDSSLLSLIALQNCIKGKCEIQKTAFAVKLILFYGAFPPAKKYKVPKRLIERVQRITKTEAMDFILEFEKMLNDIYPSISEADPSCKTKHPRLGYFNAVQWLRFIEIHLKHHLKQLIRIEKSFRS